MANGTVYQRGNIWWIKYHARGRPFYESAGKEATKDDAQRLLRKRLTDIDLGKPVTPQMNRITFDDAAQAVLDDYTINEKRSHDDVKKRTEKHLSPFFKGRPLASISVTEVNRYIVKRKTDTYQKRPTANATINRELAILRRAFNLAEKAGRIGYVPRIEMLAENNVRKGFFEPEQFEAVKRNLSKHLQPLVTFAHITGWRSSEVLTLQWRHVDFNGGCVRLDPGTTKNKEGRVFPFTQELRQLLEAQKAHTERLQRELGLITPYVFHRTGARIKDFRTAWKTACKKAGCPGRIPHDFRRTAVRRLSRAGVAERVAMTLTGHKTRSVYERYNIVNEGDLIEAVRKLDATTVTMSLQSSPSAPLAAAGNAEKP